MDGKSNGDSAPIELSGKALFELAGKLHEVLLNALTDKKGIHAETAIAAAGGLCGLFTLRIYAGLDLNTLEPGRPLFIDTVSNALENRLDQVLNLAQAVGLNPDPNSGWMGEPSEKCHPLRPVLELNRELEPKILTTYPINGVTLESNAVAMALVGVRLISEARAVVPEVEGKRLFIKALFGGAKTVPYPFQPKK